MIRRFLKREPVRDFLRAVRFLTIIPVPAGPSGMDGTAGDLDRSAVWFPAVGVLLGLVLASADAALVRLFPPSLAAALLVALWAFLTGGLHLDGLIDSCDALLASVPPARRLEILRDPHRGAFGIAGLAIFLLLKTAALADLQPPRALALLLAPAVARWAVLLLCGGACARPDGLAHQFRAGAGAAPAVRASGIPLALLALALFLSPGLRPPLAFFAAVVCALALHAAARARLGGMTGDVLGLTIETVELSVLIVYAAGP